MRRHHYTYLRLPIDSVDEGIEELAEYGWRVHTFLRAPSASMVEVLMEYVQEPS